MLTIRARAAFALGCCAMLTGAVEAQQVKRPADPNQKVCQVITPVGSRLVTKKVCATRAEWEEKKRQDREATEKAQTQQCMMAESGGTC